MDKFSIDSIQNALTVEDPTAGDRVPDGGDDAGGDVAHDGWRGDCRRRGEARVGASGATGRSGPRDHGATTARRAGGARDACTAAPRCSASGAPSRPATHPHPPPPPRSRQAGRAIRHSRAKDHIRPTSFPLFSGWRFQHIYH